MKNQNRSNHFHFEKVELWTLLTDQDLSCCWYLFDWRRRAFMRLIKYVFLLRLFKENYCREQKHQLFIVGTSLLICYMTYHISSYVSCITYGCIYSFVIWHFSKCHLLHEERVWMQMIMKFVQILMKMLNSSSSFPHFGLQNEIS